jgi:hypothetical protein
MAMGSVGAGQNRAMAMVQFVRLVEKGGHASKIEAIAVVPR